MGRMVQAKNITKHYGQLQVLKGVDLTVEKGEIVSIVGGFRSRKNDLITDPWHLRSNGPRQPEH